MNELLRRQSDEQMSPHSDISDLGSALSEFARLGERVCYVDQTLSPELEIAAHYAQQAGSPASSRSQDEGIFVYTGTAIPAWLSDGSKSDRCLSRRQTEWLVSRSAADKPQRIRLHRPLCHEACRPVVLFSVPVIRGASWMNL